MIENGQIIVVNFPPGAGGKFIQNCLGLSKHCVLKYKEWTDWQLNLPSDLVDDFYHVKLSWALETIPPSQDQFWQWLAYELRDDEFYNGILFDTKPRTLDSFPDHIHSIAKQGLWTTYSSHSHGGGENCEKYWPTVRYVNVLGEKFANRWLAKKNQLPDQGWTGFSKSPDAFNFDMDRVIYSSTEFVKHMGELYDYMGFDDYDIAPVEAFHRKYLKVHQ